MFNSQLTLNNIVVGVVILILVVVALNIMHNFNHSSFDGSIDSLLTPKDSFKSEMVQFFKKLFDRYV